MSYRKRPNYPPGTTPEDLARALMRRAGAPDAADKRRRKANGKRGEARSTDD